MTIVCAIGSWWGIQVLNHCEKAYPEITWEPVYNKAHLEDVVAQVQPTWVLLLNWSHVVPESVWGRYPTVNFHCTPLPYGRGGHPIENMILQGYTETDITAHRVTAEMDAGPVYGLGGPVSLDGTKDQIQGRLIEPVQQLIGRVLAGAIALPQEGTPVYFKRLTEQQYNSFWAARAAEQEVSKCAS